MLCSCFSTTMAAALWLLLVAAAAAATASVGAESQEQDMDYANYPDEQDDLTLMLIKELFIDGKCFFYFIYVYLGGADSTPNHADATWHG